MELGLTGKRVVVTGAGSGIGRAIAQAFAREGARVSLVGRTKTKLEETLASLAELAPPPGHRVDVADLSDAGQTGAYLEALGRAWGGVDVLVNNACSTAALRKLHEMEPAHWDQFIVGNLRGVFLLCRGLLPGMAERKWGRVVTIGSLTSELGSSHYAEYAALKAAVVGLTRNLAVDYSRAGVTANCVQPGFIRTERFERAAPAKLLESFKQATSVKRLGEPAEVADLVLFLSSERAAYVTGAVIPVGGGAGLNNLW